jgi:hypothetical protein
LIDILKLGFSTYIILDFVFKKNIKTLELPGASSPGTSTGLRPGPTGGLKAAPRPPAFLGVYIIFI